MDEERASLTRRRHQHQKNLRYLTEQAAQYGPLAVPLALKNQMDAEQEALDRLAVALTDVNPRPRTVASVSHRVAASARWRTAPYRWISVVVLLVAVGSSIMVWRLEAAPGCFRQPFANVPSDRIVNLAVGAAAQPIIHAGQPSDGPISITFTMNQQPIGALLLTSDIQAHLFQIRTVLDTSCHPIQSYQNVERPADNRVLQDWDSLQMSLNGQMYQLRLGHTNGTIEASLRQL